MNNNIFFIVSQGLDGHLLLARTSKGICCLLLGDQIDALTAELRQRFPKATLVSSKNELATDMAILNAWLQRPQGDLGLVLDMLDGTAFQRRVWQALCRIPYGETRSYTDIAKAISQPKAVRAVAQACGANPVAIAIPCHRVIRHDGSLGGFSSGLDKKIQLLALEQLN